jgi:hypothetical protein
MKGFDSQAFQCIILMPHFVSLYLNASRPSVTDQDKYFSAPVLSKCFLSSPRLFTIITVHHSQFVSPLNCVGSAVKRR